MPLKSLRARPIGWSALAALVAALAVPAPATAAAPSCAVVFDTGVHWATGFYVPGTITNTGPATLTGWRVTWRFSGTQRLTSLPNTTWTQTPNGPDVTAVNTSWDGTLGPGVSIPTVAVGSSPGGAFLPLLNLTCTAF